LHIASTWYNWLILLILTDFIWYWYHRFGHEVNLLWGLHVVHHQSPEFNLTASTRVTVFQAAARTCFWAILPIIGFPAPMIMSILVVHGLYPFFVHTRLIGKLGWLEYILVTPSHHRVHHASNEHYLDKNYGDVFIVWDRLFGTFQEELPNLKPVYGITRPMATWNPIKINFKHLWLLILDAWRTESWKDKFRIWFMPTGWRPEGFEEKYPVDKITDPYDFKKYATDFSLGAIIIFCPSATIALGFVMTFPSTTTRRVEIKSFKEVFDAPFAWNARASINGFKFCVFMGKIITYLPNLGHKYHI
jgi:hypothetical protein